MKRKIVATLLGIFLLSSHSCKATTFRQPDNDASPSAEPISTLTSKPTYTLLPNTVAPSTPTKKVTPTTTIPTTIVSLTTNPPSPTPMPTKITLSENASCNNKKIINVAVEDTRKGNLLTIQCEGGDAYQLPLIQTGQFKVSPNGMFFIYITSDGYAYAARVDQRKWKYIRDLHKYGVVDCQAKITFVESHPDTAKIYCLEGNDVTVLRLYGAISHE